MTHAVYVMLTNNTTPRGRPGRRRQSARQERFRPHHRDHRGSTATSPATRAHGRCLLTVRRSVGRRRRGEPSTARPAKNGWFGMPDTCRGRFRRAPLGRRPTATDPKETGRTDGLCARSTTEGSERAGPRNCSTACPVGAELCGPLLHARRHRPPSSRSSTPATAAPDWPEFGRRSTIMRTSRPAGRTSGPTCRCARRWSAITTQGRRHDRHPSRWPPRVEDARLRTGKSRPQPSSLSRARRRCRQKSGADAVRGERRM